VPNQRPDGSEGRADSWRIAPNANASLHPRRYRMVRSSRPTGGQPGRSSRTRAKSSIATRRCAGSLTVGCAASGSAIEGIPSSSPAQAWRSELKQVDVFGVDRGEPGRVKPELELHVTRRRRVRADHADASLHGWRSEMTPFGSSGGDVYLDTVPTAGRRFSVEGGSAKSFLRRSSSLSRLTRERTQAPRHQKGSCMRSVRTRIDRTPVPKGSMIRFRFLRSW
jgi:hypothetical protein